MLLRAYSTIKRDSLFGNKISQNVQISGQIHLLLMKAPVTLTVVTLQDPRLRESLMVGATDCPLEDKMVTIAYGIDMVNISYISFAATTKAIAQVCQRPKIDNYLQPLQIGVVTVPDNEIITESNLAIRKVCTTR